MNGVVTASDACESGGGACYASRLGRLGEEELNQLMDSGKSESISSVPNFQVSEQRVIVFDLFAGIGGLEVALKKIGCIPILVIAVEKDKNCRRVLRCRFPGVELVSDIRDLDVKKIRSFVSKVKDPTGIIVGGGSPCQGLSQLSVDRQHLEDERSKLFYDGARVLEDTRKVAVEEGLWILKFLENVVADEADIGAMSSELNMRPSLVDSESLSRAKRPRLFWLSTPLLEVEGVTKLQKNFFDVVSYEGPLEDMGDILEEGWTWKKGEADPLLRFPTFTRSIKRKKPPKSPAGIGYTTDKALERWKLHEFRFPPYTYERKYLVEGPSERIRILYSIAQNVKR